MKYRVGVAALIFVFIFAELAHAYETVASYYGYELAGSPKANGEPFDPWEYSVAHKDLPLGTVVEVCDDACVVAAVEDRGPYIWGREYDLSLGVAYDTGAIWEGVAEVEVTVLEVPY